MSETHDLPTWQITRGLERRFVGSKALELARKALMQGGHAVKPGEVEWDCASDCQSPKTIFEHEVAIDFFSAVKREKNVRSAAVGLVRALHRTGIDVDVDDVEIRHKPRAFGIKLTMSVRCRQCPKCLSARARMWQWRAVSEWEASERTWFGTLTLSPAAHEHFRNHAVHEGDVRANTFEALSSDEQFMARHRAIAPEVTKYLKRLRKAEGPFRYLVVLEAHESGLPHYHVLVHECDGHKHYEETLRKQWRLGFSKWNLVHTKRRAIYACKYLSKSALARVRASEAYGNPPLRQRDALDSPVKQGPHLFPSGRMTDQGAL